MRPSWHGFARANELLCKAFTYSIRPLFSRSSLSLQVSYAFDFPDEWLFLPLWLRLLSSQICQINVFCAAQFLWESRSDRCLSRFVTSLTVASVVDGNIWKAPHCTLNHLGSLLENLWVLPLVLQVLQPLFVSCSCFFHLMFSVAMCFLSVSSMSC